MGALNGAVLLLVAVWDVALTLDAILASPSYDELEV